MFFKVLVHNMAWSITNKHLKENWLFQFYILYIYINMIWLIYISCSGKRMIIFNTILFIFIILIHILFLDIYIVYLYLVCIYLYLLYIYIILKSLYIRKQVHPLCSKQPATKFTENIFLHETTEPRYYWIRHPRASLFNVLILF